MSTIAARCAAGTTPSSADRRWSTFKLLILLGRPAVHTRSKNLLEAYKRGNTEAIGPLYPCVCG